MRTTRIQFILVGLMILGGFGCGKKLFQSLLQQAPTSITQYEWRLTHTLDTGLLTDIGASQPHGLCYNYLLLKFTAQYRGTLTTVTNSLRANQEQAAPFSYFVIPNSKVICIDYNSPNADVADLQNRCINRATGSLEIYSYQLGRDGLHLTDLKTGLPYDYVDFRGAVNPDQQCNL